MSNVWSPTQDWPYPPANPTAMSAFTGTDVDIRWDDPATLNTGPSTPSTRAAMVITVAGSPITLQTATASITVVAGGMDVFTLQNPQVAVHIVGLRKGCAAQSCRDRDPKNDY